MARNITKKGIRGSTSFRRLFVFMVSTGALLTIGQVIVLREFMVIFYGNELSVGIVLTMWLLWGGLGSIISGILISRTENTAALFNGVAITLSCFLPLTLFLIRAGKMLWHIAPGEVVAPLLIFEMAAVLLLPFCSFSGMFFVLANIVSKRYSAESPISKLYMAEALGSALGGTLFHWVLIPYLPVISISSIVALQFLLIIFMVPPKEIQRTSTGKMILLAILLPIFALLILKAGFLDLKTRQWQWRGTQILASVDTVYNNITITKNLDQISFFSNGLWCFSTKDKQSAEEAVHFAMLQHLKPERVLLIGNAFSGTAQEVLKYLSMRQLDVVELDPKVVELAKIYLPSSYVAFLKDQRVQLHLGDPNRYVRSYRGEPYDEVIINLPEPVNALLNRFYTREFFQKVKTILKRDGVFSFRLTGAENMLGPDMARFLSSIYWTARTVFPDIVSVPGENTRFFCSQVKGALTTDPGILAERLHKRKIEARYIRSDSLSVIFDPFRITYLSSMLNRFKKSITVNEDFKPRCYFDDIVLWSKQYGQRLAFSLKELAKQDYLIVSSASVLILLLFFWIPSLFTSRKHPSLPATLFSTAVVGFTHITFEIVLILGFQILYGFLYKQLGLLVGSFMAGLALGTYWGEKKNISKQNPKLDLVFLQTFFILFAFALFLLFKTFGTRPSIWTQMPDWLTFPGLAAFTGIIGGLQIPWAVKVLALEGVPMEKSAGYLYGYDLGGSAAGCILASIVLLPLYGIGLTLLFLGIISTAAIVLILLEVSFRRENS